MCVSVFRPLFSEFLESYMFTAGGKGWWQRALKSSQACKAVGSESQLLRDRNDVDVSVQNDWLLSELLGLRL